MMMKPTIHERIASRMLRFVMVAIVTVTGMMTSPLMAQESPLPPTPCDPCSQTDRTPWAAIAEQSVTVTLGSGCSFTVYYKIRFCIDCHEVKIDRIVNANPPECDWMTQEEVASLAIGFMLKNNLIGAPALPQPGEQGAKCLKVIKPRCWRRIVSPNDCPSADGSYSPGTIVGCDASECCMNMLWVERDWCDDLRFLDMDGSGYAFKHNVRPNIVGSGENDAYLMWVNQFGSSECNFCGGPITPGKCISGCHEHLMARYNYLMQRFLQKLYKP